MVVTNEAFYLVPRVRPAEFRGWWPRGMSSGELPDGLDMDEAAVASNLLDFARQVPQAGVGLVAGLETRRTEWLAAETGVASVMAEYESATRSYGEAYYRATAVVAQGKALLMASGVWVLDRKPTRKKATPTARATPSSAAEGASISAPAPTPLPAVG